MSFMPTDRAPSSRDRVRCTNEARSIGRRDYSAFHPSHKSTTSSTTSLVPVRSPCACADPKGHASSPSQYSCFFVAYASSPRCRNGGAMECKNAKAVDADKPWTRYTACSNTKGPRALHSW